MKKTLCLALALLMALTLAACGGGSGGGSETVTINVLNWGDYIGEEVIDKFHDAHPNIRVNYNTTASNEEMLVSLSAPDSIYDVCFPSDYAIEKMIKQDMLRPINKENIPNLKNIDERFLDLGFDPGNVYSVPYMWGTVGILYNTTMVEEPVTSWRILFEKKYAGQVIMYDSIRDTIGITLKMLGYSINTRDEAHIQQAQDALIEQKPRVKAYLDDPIKEDMIRGNGALGVVYSGDAMYCMELNDQLAYVVPEEGSNYWFDNIIIPKSSKNPEAAEAFINFLCDAQIAKENTEYIGFSSPNKAALALLDPEWLEDPAYNPPAEILERCEVFLDLGDFIEVYNNAWNHIKSAR